MWYFSVTSHLRHHRASQIVELASRKSFCGTAMGGDTDGHLHNMMQAGFLKLEPNVNFLEEQMEAKVSH